MVTEAERVRDRYGITTFKVKVGRRPVQLDVGACRALREALGPDVELYVDGNRGWTASEAARALDAMADLDLTLAEEISPADDVLGRRWLTARTAVPTVADESVPTPGDVTRELLEQKKAATWTMSCTSASRSSGVRSATARPSGPSTTASERISVRMAPGRRSTRDGTEKRRRP